MQMRPAADFGVSERLAARLPLNLIIFKRRNLFRIGYAVVLAQTGLFDIETAFADSRFASSVPAGIFILADPNARLDMTFAQRGPVNGIVLSGGGPLISFCPQLACVLSPTPDHQRAAAIFAAATRDDGHSEEQTVAILTTVKTGGQKVWQPGQPYAVGDNVAFSDARNAIYRATTAGISNTMSGGPSGKGSDIIDGTVHWKWINDAAIGAKVGLYNEVATLPGGGASWGQANNVHLQPGATPSFNVNTEFDFANDAGDCVIGRSNCNNVIVAMSGSHTSTSGVYVLSDNVSGYAVHWGLRLAGHHLASDADIEDDAEAPVGLAIGAFGLHRHSRASILDQATGAASYLITGDHTVASIEDMSRSPASIDIGGTHSIAGLVEQSRSQNGIALNGHYAGAQIVGKGFLVDPEGNLTARSVTTSVAYAAPTDAPTSSHSPCRKGQVSVDNDFIYACVGNDHWRRSALSDF